jgi:hypothetical protein
MSKRERNHGQSFLISAEPLNHSGPRLYFTRKRFSNIGAPARFPTLASAQKVARWLLSQFDILKKYRINVTGLDEASRAVGIWRMNPIGVFTLLTNASNAKSVLDATRSKRRKGNPDPYPFHRARGASDPQLKRAAHLLKDFSGHSPSEILRLQHDPISKGLVIGTLDAVPYTTVRDGKTEHYIHEFKKTARPLLIASSDGRRLGIVGGRFQFTEAGIVDD